MRRRYCTITPATGRHLAHAARRRALDWQPFGRRVTPRKLVDLLLLVAALGSSLFDVVRRFAFGYETARKAVHANLPVGLLPVVAGQQPHRILAAVLEQMADRGLRLRGVAPDSGFDSGEVIRLLRRRGLAYAVPLRRKGTGSNAHNDFFARPVGEAFTAAWATERSRRAVRTRAVAGR